MHVITVDDEPLMLYALSKAVKASPDVTSVAEFTSCDDALAWVKEHPVEIAFLDIDTVSYTHLTLPTTAGV